MACPSELVFCVPSAFMVHGYLREEWSGKNPDVPVSYGNPFETVELQKDKMKIGVDDFCPFSFCSTIR